MISAVIFILAGITDILDGYIARKFNIITKWGKLMDPLADKAIQLTVIFCLAYIKLVPLWAIFIILIKEILMVIGGVVLYKDKIVVGANWYGKAATLLFYVSILAIIVFKDSLTDFQRILLVVIALAGTLFAFVRYTLNFRKIKYPKDLRHEG